MTELPHPRLGISKAGLLISIAVLAFGLYTAITFFRSGGHGHAMTVLRALVAIPIGCVGVYLSFSTVCSVCGVSFTRRDLRTSEARAVEVMRAATTGDGNAVGRACTAAAGEPGTTRVTVEVCPKGHDLARLHAPGTSGGEPPRILAGAAARPIASAILALPASN